MITREQLPNYKKKEYVVWEGMRQRCNNPNHNNYHRYGGRGISICEEWDNFDVFLLDMGNRPEGYQIDRIDNNKGYSKENCRWVSRNINTSNTSDKARELPRGIYIQKNRYVVKPTIFRKSYFLGSFVEIKDALNCYNEFSLEWYGLVRVSSREIEILDD